MRTGCSLKIRDVTDPIKGSGVHDAQRPRPPLGYTAAMSFLRALNGFLPVPFLDGDRRARNELEKGKISARGRVPECVDRSIEIIESDRFNKPALKQK